MVKTKEYITEDRRVLCNTYSTTKHKLLQKETDIIYGCSVIDILEGYNNDGTPYSRYHYEETDIEDTESEE